MRNRLVILGLVLASVLSPAASLTNVVGHLQKPDATPLTASTKVLFELTYCGNNQATVQGVGKLPNPKLELTAGRGIDASTGVISAYIYGNDQITCGGVTGGSRWRVTYYVNNQASPSCEMEITGDTWNLDAAQCVTNKPVPVPPTGDTTYVRLDGGNIYPDQGVFTTLFTAPPGPIGDLVPVPGRFASLASDGTVEGIFVGDLTGNVVGNVTGNTTGAHNGTVGATTPSTGAFTDVTASGGISGNFSGDVVGNVTGNLTGNVTGNVSGTAGSTSVVSDGGTATNLSLLAGVAANSSGFKHKRFGSPCTTAATAGATCTGTLAWNTPFADTNYTVVCTAYLAGNTPAGPSIENITPEGFDVRIYTIEATASTYAGLHCIGIHD